MEAKRGNVLGALVPKSGTTSAGIPRARSVAKATATKTTTAGAAEERTPPATIDATQGGKGCAIYGTFRFFEPCSWD